MSSAPSPLSNGRTREVLEFVRQYHARYDYPPSLQEIGEHFQLTRRSVERHLTRLDGQHLLRWTPAKPRGIDLIQAA